MYRGKCHRLRQLSCVGDYTTTNVKYSNLKKIKTTINIFFSAKSEGMFFLQPLKQINPLYIFYMHEHNSNRIYYKIIDIVLKDT